VIDAGMLLSSAELEPALAEYRFSMSA